MISNMENNLSGYIKDHEHYLPVRVYYSDTDMGGVVYHSRYLDMAEHGRTELLRCLGGHQKELLSEQNMIFVVKSLFIDYKRPALMDDLLLVVTTVTKCERFTLVFHQEICRGGEVLATLDVKAGSISGETGRPVPMPEEIKTELHVVQPV
jgi:acyl-CoA thioester hydrolase